MSNYEPYNPNSPQKRKDILITNRLFVASLTIYALTFIIFAFQDHLGVSKNLLNGLFSILILAAFSINVFGFIKGIKEWNVNREMAINGIVGNLIPILVILVMLGIGIYFYYQIANLDFNFSIPKVNKN